MCVFFFPFPSPTARKRILSVPPIPSPRRRRPMTAVRQARPVPGGAPSPRCRRVRGTRDGDGGRGRRGPDDADVAPFPSRSVQRSTPVTIVVVCARDVRRRRRSFAVRPSAHRTGYQIIHRGRSNENTRFSDFSAVSFLHGCFNIVSSPPSSRFVVRADFRVFAVVNRRRHRRCWCFSVFARARARHTSADAGRLGARAMTAVARPTVVAKCC